MVTVSQKKPPKRLHRSGKQERRILVTAFDGWTHPFGLNHHGGSKLRRAATKASDGPATP
jgi:hypothetical protein